MRIFVKSMIWLVTFIGALYFFGSNMDETVFRIDIQTMQMKEATLPMICLSHDGRKMNQLHGYTTNLDTTLMRETMIPVTAERTFEVLIDEYDNVVRKLKYEVVNTRTGALYQSGTISAFERVDGEKTTRVRLAEGMTEGCEYAVKITLITAENERSYYYFRLVYFRETHFSEMYDFLMDFSANARNEEKESLIAPYLESEYTGAGTNYAKVTIKDSYYMNHWGDLKPVVMTEPIPQFTDVSKNITVAKLNYIVSLLTDNGMEYYIVEEHFRIYYTTIDIYLLNYERTMESLFDANLSSISRNDLRIGLTKDSNIPLMTTMDQSMVAFVRNNELWHYTLADNSLCKVFSFASENPYDERCRYDQHEIRILTMEESGDLTFMVFGYMNRGVYEGQTGIAIYRYYKAEERIEEKMFVPMDETYQMMHGDLSTVSYMSEQNNFYFVLGETLYRYNIITRILRVLAEEMNTETLAYLKEDAVLMWQGIEDNTVLYSLDMEKDVMEEVYPSEGEYLCLFGQTGNNVAVGYGKYSDILTGGDGKDVLAMYRLNILDAARTILKTYEKLPCYITEAVIGETAIYLGRVLKTTLSGTQVYEAAAEDYIINRVTETDTSIYISKLTTDKMLAEYFISFPSRHVMKEAPTVTGTVNTVIEENTSVRITDYKRDREEYYVYSFGTIEDAFYYPADAIRLANEVIGTVINEQGHVVWERGVKSAGKSILTITKIDADEKVSSVQAAVSMMLAHCGVPVEPSSVPKDTPVTEIMKHLVSHRAVSLNGATLDEVLYFVYSGQPVFAMKNYIDAVLITGYTASTVTMIDPASQSVELMLRTEAQTMFSAAGNVYISFVN